MDTLNLNADYSRFTCVTTVGVNASNKMTPIKPNISGLLRARWNSEVKHAKPDLWSNIRICRDPLNATVFISECRHVKSTDLKIKFGSGELDIYTSDVAS